MNEPFVNDTATLDDALGTNQLGDYVAKMVLQVETPFTLGVTGKWGSGKTSVLTRAFATLGGEPMKAEVPMAAHREEVTEEAWERWKFDKRLAGLGWTTELEAVARSSFCVWYSPWQHQSAENPLVPLLLEIKAQFSQVMKLRVKGDEILRRAWVTGVTLLEHLGDLAFSLATQRRQKTFRGMRESLEKAWEGAVPKEPELGAGQRFHLLFEDAVETLLAGLKERASELKTPGRLVVFIDDLDRCEEGAIVELLEAIKLYMGSRHCVFVLGLDEAALLSALGRHWPGRSEDANREYLEKLFQASLPVALPRAEKVRSYVSSQLLAQGLPAEFCTPLADMIEELLEPNPRRIKNFTNSYGAAWGLLRKGLPDTLAAFDGLQQAQRLVLFQYMRLYHRAVWRLLERQPFVLRCLTYVLKGSPRADYERYFPEGGPVGAAEQRILEALLFSAFSHVLAIDALNPSSELGIPSQRADRHRHLTIHEAVSLFTERLDRKRSDECFVRYYGLLISLETILEPHFLHLPDPATS